MLDRETATSRDQAVSDTAGKFDVLPTQVRDTYYVLRSRGIIDNPEKDMYLLDAAIEMEVRTGLSHYRTPDRIDPIVDQVSKVKENRDRSRKESAPGSGS